MTSNQRLTQTGTSLGTPAYMSPEQCRGEALDARSDIYSLGVLAYRMVSGALPFSGDTPTLIRKHLTESPPGLRGGRRGVPRPVAEIIAQALEKDPARRPPSAAAAGLRPTGAVRPPPGA
jgi:serine/threonine-protein kinase